MRTRAALTMTGWLAGITAAVVGVTIAMSLLGHELLNTDDDDPTLTAAQVQQQLAQSGHPAARLADPDGDASGPAAGATASGATAQQFPSGIVSATCVAGQASLSTWSVAQGFRVAGKQAGPAGTASISFVSSASELLVTVTCVGNVPHFASTPQPAASATAGAGGVGVPAGDAGGGGRKGGGSGRGGGSGSSGVIRPGSGPGGGPGADG
jgi:hypothetical protein